MGTSRRFDERLTIALLAMRASLAPSAPPYPSHPSARFAGYDFGRLVARVEQGPETWDEEWHLDHAEGLEEYDAEEEDTF